MRFVVLVEETPADAAVVACRGAGVSAAVVVGSAVGELTAALGAAGIRVATFAGSPRDPALAELAAELFGADAERLELPDLRPQ